MAISGTAIPSHLICRSSGRATARYLVELPRQPYGDGRTYAHRNNDAGNPRDTLDVWKSMFDEFYDESKSVATYVPFQIHDYISGRPGRGPGAAQHRFSI